MNSVNEIYCLMIKEIKKKNIPLRVLANNIGCTPRHLQYFIKGNRTKLSLELTDKLLKELGLSLVIGVNDETIQNKRV